CHTGVDALPLPDALPILKWPGAHDQMGDVAPGTRSRSPRHEVRRERPCRAARHRGHLGDAGDGPSAGPHQREGPDMTVEGITMRSEEHTSELQSRFDLVC